MAKFGSNHLPSQRYDVMKIGSAAVLPLGALPVLTVLVGRFLPRFLPATTPAPGRASQARVPQGSCLYPMCDVHDSLPAQQTKQLSTLHLQSDRYSILLVMHAGQYKATPGFITKVRQTAPLVQICCQGASLAQPCYLLQLAAAPFYFGMCPVQVATVDKSLHATKRSLSNQ